MMTICLPVLCLAQAPPSGTAHPEWRLEPTAVFGIKLGTALPGDAIPRCGANKSNKSSSGVQVCADREPTARWVSIAGLPVVHFKGGVITLDGGIAVAMHLPAQHSDYARIRALLLEWYGGPTTRTMDQVRTVSGDVVASEILIWEGLALELTLVERSGSIDRSAASFVHKLNFRTH